MRMMGKRKTADAFNERKERAEETPPETPAEARAKRDKMLKRRKRH